MSIRCCLLAAGLFVCASAGSSSKFSNPNLPIFKPSNLPTIQNLPDSSPFTWNRTVDFSKNTIDFRYPNYIVDPLVDCPHEGVFPHPHDCTWYYRCHDRYNFTKMGIFGMYWRSYYQCEPGTEFLDSLDQCVFKGDARNCKKEVVCTQRIENCYTKRSCDASIEGSSVLKELEICEVATKDCPGKKSVSICSNDSYYDKTNEKCIQKSLIDNCTPKKPQSDFPEQPILCLDVMESCIDIDVCRKGGKRQTERLCELKRKCHGPNQRITEQNLCRADKMFNSLTNICVYTPKIEDACVAGKPAGKKPVGSCTKQIEHCSIKPDCVSKLDTLVCTGVFMCGNNVARRSLCPAGELYLPTLGRCTSGDQTSLFRQSVDCVTTHIAPKPHIDHYVCKAGDSSIPWAEGHPDIKCQKRELCKENEKKPSKIVVGCDSYFQCQGVGSPVKLRCPGTQFFDYNKMKCIDVKTDYGENLHYCIEASVTVSIPISVECKRDGDIPKMTGDTLKLNCNQETVCAGNFETLTLCDNYYECSKNANDVVKPIKRQCKEGFSFYPDSSTCKKTPTNLCNARQLAMLLKFRESVKSATNVQ